MSIPNKFSTHQFIDCLFGQVWVEAPVELRECRSFCKTGCLETRFSEAGFSVIQFVLYHAGKDLCERSVLIGLDDPGIEGRDHAIEPEGFEMSFDFSKWHIHGFISFFLFHPVILVLFKGSLACAEHEVAPGTYPPGPGWILEWVGLPGRSRVPADSNQTR